MGMKMNTLYVILILLVVLGIVYLSLNYNTGDDKEGFGGFGGYGTSLNVVLNLVGNDFYKLPTDQEVKDAVDKPYPKRFDNAIKYAVYALYKSATGSMLLGEKMGDVKNVIDGEMKKGRSTIDGMSKEQTESILKEVTTECKDAIKIQKSVETIINTLTASPKNVCGEPFTKSIDYEGFKKALNSVKICRKKVKDAIASQQSLNVLRDVSDFSLQLITEVLKYLDLLNAELIILADCPTAESEGAGCPTKEGNTNMRATNKSSPSGYDDAYSTSLTSETQQSNLPRGVPKYMIPPGQEDLYILKSEIVPPVCPACPDPVLKCNDNSTPPPPCPPCARCPEPAFDCKKVPNYGTGNIGANYNNFGAGFGATMGPNGPTTSLPYPASSQTSMFGA